MPEKRRRIGQLIGAICTLASKRWRCPAVVNQIMADALARCYSITADGVKKIEFVSATNEEFAEVKALGQKAVAPLARYLDLQEKNGLTQLFAVKFLMAIGGSTTLSPLVS
jgi:hypothetical protein